MSVECFYQETILLTSDRLFPESRTARFASIVLEIEASACSHSRSNVDRRWKRSSRHVSSSSSLTFEFHLIESTVEWLGDAFVSVSARFLLQSER